MDKKEIKRLKFMISYAYNAPSFDSAKIILRDALNGVSGAENCQEIRTEIEILRDALKQISGLPYLPPSQRQYADYEKIALKALDRKPCE